MIDQQDLVRHILDGDKRAFRTLVEQHQRLVGHVVFRMLPMEADREDLCQEVFLRVYQNLGRFRFDAKLSTWIATIAHNCCLDFLAKKRLPLYDDLAVDGEMPEPAAPDSFSPEQITSDGETAGILRREIDHLPPVYKTIVTLYHLDDLSYGEIARIMNMPEGTIKSYLFRARRLLKDRLAVQFQGEKP
jgi:RNA polymerase sigma factor (sigma-70 family)